MRCRFTPRCTRCQTGNSSRRERGAKMEAPTGSPETIVREAARILVAAKKSTRRLALSGVPSSRTILRVGAAKQLRQAHKFQRALGLRLQIHQRRLRSSPRLCPRSSEGSAQDQGGCSCCFCLSVMFLLFVFYVIVDLFACLTD